MRPASYVLLALAIVIFAASTGQGGYLLRSVERGLGWGVGREIARGMFR